jgi:hypothetical protein
MSGPQAQQLAQLEQDLQNPQKWQEFRQDPAAFTSQYGLNLDPAVSSQLSHALANVSSVDDARQAVISGSSAEGSPQTFGVAVAMGAFAAAGSKIAIAF